MAWVSSPDHHSLWRLKAPPPSPVCDSFELLRFAITLLLLRFAISQVGIAARMLTLLQGSEEKKTTEKQQRANRTRARDLADVRPNHYIIQAPVLYRQRTVFNPVKEKKAKDSKI